MKIALGNDHAGYPLKHEVISILKSLGVEIIDHGSHIRLFFIFAFRPFSIYNAAQATALGKLNTFK